MQTTHHLKNEIHASIIEKKDTTSIEKINFQLIVENCTPSILHFQKVKLLILQISFERLMKENSKRK